MGYALLVAMAKKGERGLRDKMGDWWKGKRDSHMAILSTIFTASCVMIVASLAQFLFLQDVEGFENYTGPAWAVMALGAIIVIFIGPEFFHYLGQRATLLDALKLDSRSEMSKIRGEAEEAARLLGNSAQERLNEHLSSLGLKKMRR